MAYTFTTRSGAAYKVANGRITRVEGNRPITDRAGNINSVPIVDQLVTFRVVPTKFNRCVFYTPSHPDGVSTSEVLEVTPCGG